MLQRLDPSRYGAVSRLYERQHWYFPLVGAVLERTQDGAVFADNAASPKCAFVQHKFGFAQMFGALNCDAETWLERHTLIDRAFDGPKLRLYAPIVPGLLQRRDAEPFRSERQRFQLPAAPPRPPVLPREIACFNADSANIAAIDQTFGVVTRFWRTAEDFIAHSSCVLIARDGTPAALCYGAAVAGGRAEIDVLTLPEHRNLGLGRTAVEAFNARCASAGIAPLWDCFTNNAGSMNLARAVGFEPIGAPYAFFTMAK